MADQTAEPQIQSQTHAEPELTKNAFDPRGVLQKNIKLFVYLGAALLVIRVTEIEYAALEREAWRTGHKVGDWAREQLLERMKRAEDDRISAHVFTELVGLQMLLMGSFSHLLQGQTLTAEQCQELAKNVQSGKAKRAKELLAQRLKQEDR
jgi:hypothetical protein